MTRKWTSMPAGDERMRRRREMALNRTHVAETARTGVATMTRKRNPLAIHDQCRENTEQACRSCQYLLGLDTVDARYIEAHLDD